MNISNLKVTETGRKALHHICVKYGIIFHQITVIALLQNLKNILNPTSLPNMTSSGPIISPLMCLTYHYISLDFFFFFRKKMFIS